MPIAPRRLCACGEKVEAGTYCACQIQRQRERPSARQRGYDWEWQVERAAFLKVHRVCAECGSRPATVVHHIIPHRGNRQLFRDRSNWAAVCKPCHDGPIQSRERLRYGTGRARQERTAR